MGNLEQADEALRAMGAAEFDAFKQLFNAEQIRRELRNNPGRVPTPSVWEIAPPEANQSEQEG